MERRDGEEAAKLFKERQRKEKIRKDGKGDPNTRMGTNERRKNEEQMKMREKGGRREEGREQRRRICKKR